nr:hypothetical protein [uncultured Trichococcus sp.]
MTMTKEQFERCERSCERMEAAGGPKSQAEAMLYHQYKQQKQQLEDARKSGKEQFQSDILEKLLEVQQLERSIEKLQGQLQNEKSTLGNMTKTLVLLGDEL